MTQKNYKIKRGDLVQVMVGKHKGDRGRVEKVLLNLGKAVVLDVNQVVRHVRTSEANPEGRVLKTHPLELSNLALVDPSTNLPGKIAYRFEDGEKKRFFKKTGALLVSDKHVRDQSK